MRVELERLQELTALSVDVVRALSLAASVMMDRTGRAVAERSADVEVEGARHTMTVVAREVSATDRLSYADVQEATEEGAEALAIATAAVVLDRRVFRRLPKATGADYLMHPRETDSDASDHYERLECSGVGEGKERARARLEEKLRQLRRYPEQPPGWAVVTDFRPETLVILAAKAA